MESIIFLLIILAVLLAGSFFMSFVGLLLFLIFKRRGLAITSMVCSVIIFIAGSFRLLDDLLGHGYFFGISGLLQVTGATCFILSWFFLRKINAAPQAREGTAEENPSLLYVNIAGYSSLGLFILSVGQTFGLLFNRLDVSNLDGNAIYLLLPLLCLAGVIMYFRKQKSGWILLMIYHLSTGCLMVINSVSFYMLYPGIHYLSAGFLMMQVLMLVIYCACIYLLNKVGVREHFKVSAVERRNVIVGCLVVVISFTAYQKVTQYLEEGLSAQNSRLKG